MFRNIALIVRFNQIVLTLALLGVNKLTNEEKYIIWYVITDFTNTNENIVESLLGLRAKKDESTEK